MPRAVLIAVAVIALLLGAVWTLQGAGILPGSFMTGDPMWLIIGIVLLVVGVVVGALALRRRNPKA